MNAMPKETKKACIVSTLKKSFVEFLAAYEANVATFVMMGDTKEEAIALVDEAVADMYRVVKGETK